MINTEAPAAGPLAWARVLGFGALRLDYGHAVAVNSAGRVLVAARFDGPSGETPDTGELVQLDMDGAERWRTVLTGAKYLRAPAIAIDARGAAYLAGPYERRDRGQLDGTERICLTKLEPDGRSAWSEPLARMAVVHELPVQPALRVAADPHGGVCVAWTESGAICVARFSKDGAACWERRFPFRGSVDPRMTIAADGSGSVTLSGQFQGSVRFEGGASIPLQSQGSDRFLARVQLDGYVQWSRVLRSTQASDYSIAVHRDGAITLAAVVRHRAGDRRNPTARDLCIAELDAKGSTTKRTRLTGSPHTCADVVIASTGGHGLALAGYFSGTFKIAEQEVSSTTAASESVLVGRIGAAGGSWVRALHGPEFQAGLSVHGDSSGTVLLAGWFAGGTMCVGDEHLAARERAALFVARYS